MSAARINIEEVGELRNSEGPSPSFMAKWVEGKKSKEGSNSSIFLFLIPTLFGLIQVKDQFESPANMWISIAAMFIFCLSYAAMNQTQYGTRYSQIIESFQIISGELVAASVLSILLPHRRRWLFFVIWALDVLVASIVAFAHDIYKFIFTWIYLGVMKAFQPVCNIANRFIARTHHSAGRCFA